MTEINEDERRKADNDRSFKVRHSVCGRAGSRPEKQARQMNLLLADDGPQHRYISVGQVQRGAERYS